MKIVIDLSESGSYDEAMITHILRQMKHQRDTGGYLDLTSPDFALEVRIDGVVTAEDCPGDQKIMAVEPLT